jgi:lipopolysaccharide transport system permease protein
VASTERVVYSASPFLRHPGQLLRRMLEDLVASRELAWYLALRSFRAQYRQSLLGYAWIIIQPVAMTAVWVLLSASGVLNLGRTGNYVVYVLIGATLWQCFVDALLSPLNQLTGSKSMLTTANFPREALIVAGLAEVSVDAAARLIVLALVLLAVGTPVPATALLAPIPLLALLCLGTALGLVLVPIGMLYLDVQRALALGTSLWFLVTPIVYEAPSTGPLALIGILNPVAPLLVTGREWLMTGHASHPQAFVIVSVLACCGLAASWILCRVAMPHVVVRLPVR